MKSELKIKTPLTVTACYHCGEDCITEIKFEEKVFCCEGCKLVYELLSGNNLCTYYSLNEKPGTSFQSKGAGRFEYLDNDEILKKLIAFTDGKQTHITFYIPEIHCSSCIWLLENLHKLNPGVISSTVNFLKKEARIVYSNEEIRLSTLVSLLAKIGYEPLISLQDLEKKPAKKKISSRILKIGVAGFGFGNIMMLSFPEYFSLGEFYGQAGLKNFFSTVILIISLPVLFYSSSEFFVSAWKSIRQKFLNIDAPIALAIAVTFLRSIYEIFSGTGPGYLDSMSGIIFFMLIGRYFQDLTYDSISFERDYRSFFPISISVKKNNTELSTPVENLRKGDVILIRNNELIPSDSYLMSDSTHIDYSFVTGESRPLKVLKGELIYAGGRQLQGTVEMQIEKEISQSYLTSLWDKERVQNKKDQKSFIHAVSKYFTFVLFSIALASFIFWWLQGDLAKGMNALTTSLIVACPCALLLSATFTNGNIIRMLGRAKFYIKNSTVIERLGEIDTIIFDKTGTITHGAKLKFEGKKLTAEEDALVKFLASNSTHPLSKKIAEGRSMSESIQVTDYEEFAGNGIRGYVNGVYIIMGSEYFVTGSRTAKAGSSHVFVRINEELKGFYSIENMYRNGIFELVEQLKSGFKVMLLSGDNAAEKENLKSVFGEEELYFNQKPEDKSEFIRKLQQQGHKVLMIGDGLNDTGALLTSDVGIAVSDNTNNFSPSCDAIIQGNSFVKLYSIISYAKSGKKIIYASFILSVLYNIIGLYFAAQGTLSPVIAAILMPISSISIVLLTTISSNLIAAGKLRSEK